MPVTSTLVLGQSWLIVNNSSGAVTVQSSGANTIIAMAAGTQARFTVILTSGTTAASWNSSYNEGEFVIPVVVSQGGTGLQATTAYALLAGGTTTTSALQQVAASTIGFPLVYKGSSAIPAYSSTPIITQILDTNGLELVGLTTVATAVNYVNFSNNSTGNKPIAQGKGSDTNVILSLRGQGTGGAETQGTSTNDNAVAGYVGEFISSVIAVASAISITSVTAENLTSISLPAGDWDVWGNITFIPAATTSVVSVISWLSSSSATIPDASLFNSNTIPPTVTGAGSTLGNVAPSQRFSLSGTTTIYISGFAVFSVSTMTICGGIYARRIR